MDIEKAFNEHRKKAISCCDESCFCWEVEQLINKKMEDKEDERA